MNPTAPYNNGKNFSGNKFCIMLILLIIIFGGCTYPSDNFTGNVKGAITFAIYGDNRDNFDIHRQIVMKM
jgi:hypothetical protein